MRASAWAASTPAGQIEVLHLEGVFVVARCCGLGMRRSKLCGVVADDQRGVLRTEKAGAVGRRAEEAIAARC